MASRFIAFGMVGVVGGEVCSRVRHGIAVLESGNAIDDWSRVYNQSWAGRTLVSARERAVRYHEPFSVVLITVSKSLFEGVSAHRQRTIVRKLADHMRAGVRMVDEIARLDDGRFLVMLPHTQRTGADIVAIRATETMKAVLGARDEAVHAVVLSAPENIAGIDALIGQIGPADDQLDSVEYRSAGLNTRKPALDSASSAP
jgi:GGDEF domain-containing protein